MIHSIDGAAALGEVEDVEDRELLMASLRQAMVLSKRIAKEDRELLMASLRQAMVLSKRIAKKKFTPKKYRNEP